MAATSAPSPPTPVAKTFPTQAAGPHHPSRPLQQPLLRLFPGSPRYAEQAVVPLDPALHCPTALTLIAAVGSLSVEVPLPSNSLPTHYLDFPLLALSGTTLHLRVITDTSTLQASLVKEDFAPRKGVLRRVLHDEAGIPRAIIVMDFLVITPAPFAAPSAAPVRNVPRLIGHRGMGSSGPHAPRRPLENDPASFLMATMLNRDVNTVELDVQITRDGRVVLYHDWFYRPGGARDKDAGPGAVKVPVYNLTFEELDTLYRTTFTKKQTGMQDERFVKVKKEVEQLDDVPNDVMETRLWSLRDICKVLPEEVGLLVEVKYPAPNVQDDEWIPFPEKNKAVDAVLTDLFSEKRNLRRQISFLSFDADLCMMLALKQTLYPVYLSHCEVMDKPCDEFDPRCIDLEEGLRYSLSQEFAGMMLFNELVDRKPDVVKKILDKGLPIITYGKRNRDAEYVSKAFSTGIAGIIADDIDILAYDLENLRRMS